jgi:outer membrane cobalamin receptor
LRTQVRRAATAIGTLGISLLRVSATAAQAADSTNAYPRVLPATVVTATRIPVNTPSVATDVITAGELRALGAPNLADAMRGIAGLQLVQTGSATLAYWSTAFR